ncbi:tyrosine-type recombinase/integrase [Actinotalea sp.]|uniref:tyrosine-type recombinase/integrase n=1 Tax=Actinotalea sp. TaxID=1872145 RepID=UPI003561C474
MVSISRRFSKDGHERFRVGYRQDGQLRWTPTIETAEGAVEMKGLIERLGPDAALAILARRSGRTTDTSTTLLATVLERHLEALAASATPGTVAEYRRLAARTWGPRLGPLPVDAITREAVTAWIGWQRQQTTNRGRAYSPKSIANAHGLLSAVLSRAVELDLVGRNVAHKVPLPSDAEGPEMVILTEAEFIALLTATPAHWRPLVGTLFLTGLRWGEATALTPDDLDLDADTPVLRVSRAWKKGAAGVYLGAPKTRKGRRTVSLPPELVPVLRAQAQGRAGGDLLFTAAQGGRVSAQHFHGRVWRPALAAAGLTKRPRVHDLRHSHASHMLAQGEDIYSLSRRMGHESVKVTGDVYGHLLPDAHTRSAEVAGRIAPGAFPAIGP